MKILPNTFFMKSINLFILNSILFFSCAQQVKHPVLDSILKVTGKQFKNEIVVIIPNQGCEGCISVAEDFVKDNLNHIPQASFIFTRIHSVKLLKLKLGSSFIDAPNLIFDLNNEIQYPDSKTEIYPMIVYLENGKVKQIEYQSPFNSGFENLKNRISAKEGND
jgi:hypothetical protein